MHLPKKLALTKARMSGAFAAAVFATICSIGAAQAQSGPNNLVLSFDNLAPLDEAVDGHYEGWAILSGSPHSTGKFNVNDMG
ncbi:MAG: hypothetical protein KC729_05295, partial [Candidatus Eisenbacteria bacterium]|nr:hypothetical protein [Candidatus Eisenbacteria bacterium]